MMVSTEVVKSISMGEKEGFGLRFSLEVKGNEIFTGNNGYQTAEIYV